MSPEGRNGKDLSKTMRKKPQKESDMNIDKVIAFYTKLGMYLENQITFKVLPPELVEIQSQETLSVGNISVEDIEMWHQEYHDHTIKDDPGIEWMEWLAECLFQDLASVMQIESVRLLHEKFKKLAGISDDLFIHTQELHDLGDAAAVATVVTDDIVAFRAFL
jgi:hypothetical protein